MPLSLLSKVMSELYSTMPERSQQEVNVYYSGGEPLLAGLEFFEAAMDLQKQYASSGYKITNILQTNGTLLDDDWVSFIQKHGFGVSISLDGPKEIQDAHRPMHNTDGSFSRVMQAINLLKEKHITFGLISVITEDSAPHVETILKFLLAQDPAIIALLPCVERGSVISPETFGDFLVKGFDLWFDPGFNRKFIPERTYQGICLDMFKINSRKSCDYIGICPLNPNIAPDGAVSICDQFVGSGDGLLGNLNKSDLGEILESPRIKELLKYSETLSDTCAACPYLNYCGGGCIYRRVRNNGLDYFCVARKRLFQHIDNRIELVINKGKMVG